MKKENVTMQVKMDRSIRTITVTLLTLLISFASYAQDESSEESKVMIQPRKLIDSHTAGVLPKAHFDLETRIYPSGDPARDGSGLSFSFSVGITDRLNLGGGYGGDGIIGRNNPQGNPYPSLFIKYRLLEESFLRPALALGFDPTGYGGIENDSTNYKGYIYKSQGFFVALSKNYLIFKRIQLGLHGSVNFAFEDVIKDHKEIKWPNVFLGIDLSFNEELAISLEYDWALNQMDKKDDPSDAGDDKYANPLYGIFNIGLRWNIVDNLYLELLAKDVTSMKQENNTEVVENDLGWSREIKIVYIGNFLSRRNRDRE